jgi:16S rRNA (cytidine1402-2'-O)-methyltransferase
MGKALASGFPLVLFESPLRVANTLRELEELSPGRQAMVARELTKLHEELIRGSVAQLADRLSEHSPRGEVVIVVGEAYDAGAATGQDDAERLAQSILDRGVKPGRAAREISSILGLDGRDAYALVLRVAGERSESGNGT